MSGKLFSAIRWRRSWPASSEAGGPDIQIANVSAMRFTDAYGLRITVKSASSGW
jgi:hypothetical protein